MCFLSECDWYAEEQEEYGLTHAGPWRCDECGRTFPAGVWFTHIFLGEHEHCQTCSEGDCKCPRGSDGYCGGCECPDPDLGESFDYDRCRECSLFLEGVEAAELAAGCAPSESRPSLGAMREEIQSQGAAEAKKYYQHAARLHPELVAGGYLKRLWRGLFGR